MMPYITVPFGLDTTGFEPLNPEVGIIGFKKHHIDLLKRLQHIPITDMTT